MKPKIFTLSHKLISTNYALRCDAKYADTDVIKVDAAVRAAGCFELGSFLPQPFIKGIQPDSLDQPTDDSVPVVNTLSIQNMSINTGDCRHIAVEDFDALGADRQLKVGDVLLTVDGGVSIGKPALFDLSGNYTVDSHVTILRPQGISPLALVYLLASPLGQMQFRRAESGASGQTTVTEDDIRRFVFPSSVLGSIEKTVAAFEKARKVIASKRRELDIEEATLWSSLGALSDA